MQSYFRDVIRNLRDTIGTVPTVATASHSLSQSVSSIDAAGSTISRAKSQKKLKISATGSVTSGDDSRHVV